MVRLASSDRFKQEQRIQDEWKRWHEAYPDHANETIGFERVHDFVFCDQHDTVHEVDRTLREMQGMDCYCDPMNRRPIFKYFG